jgi:branched-chain amino acid transport system substrate-binding protein
MKSANLRLSLAAACLVAAFASCGRPGTGALRIGIVAPLTGPMSDIGAGTLEGAELALQALEREGGLVIAGRRVRVETALRDAQNKPDRAVAAGRELINREGVSVLIGPPLSAQAIPVARLADRSGIPMITQIATHPDVTRGSGMAFRICYTDAVQGEAIARFARESLGIETAAVLYDVATVFTKGMADVFRERFEARGGRVVAFEGYTAGEKDFRPALSRIKTSRAQALFLPGYSYDIRPQVAQIRELAIGIQILGCDSMSFRNASDTALVQGAYYATHFSDENPSPVVQSFAAAYHAEYERAPSASGALTYDAMRWLFAAIRRAQSVDPRRIAMALADSGRYEGVTGVAVFNGTHDPAKSVVILQVRGDQSHFFLQIDPR